ncbi:MAG: hypothetical protein HS115_00560 [Spirochaetales bacterium]|nr:hypothetical protein [Spirochaetales bacterium]
MHLSTSSSDPSNGWKKTLIVTALLTLLCLSGYEFYWRLRGFVPVHTDTKEHWASVRQKLKQKTGAIAFVGASRVFYGIHREILQKETGRPVFQLAINGSSALPVIHDLANDPDFQGIIISGVSPQYFFNIKNPYRIAESWVSYSRQQTPADRLSHLVTKNLERLFAYPEKRELFFQVLLGQLYEKEPDISTQLSFMDENRYAYMPAIVQETPEVRDFIIDKQIREVKDEKSLSERELALEINRLKESVRQLDLRSSQLIFLRMPSSGQYYAEEERIWPRSATYDRLLVETGARGIHFKDYPTLQFPCPDESHLSQRSAEAFSRELAQILQTLP